MANLADLIEARFGVKTEGAVNRSTAQLGVAVSQVLRNNPKRLAALIVNLSVNAVYVGPFGDVSATKGVRLSPSGGTLSLSWDVDFDLTGYEWMGVAAGAASDVLVLEVMARD